MSKKLLVVTTGAFMLMLEADTVVAGRPCVVNPSHMLKQKVSEDQIEVISNDLPADATDEGFKSFYDAHDQDVEEALSNYVHSLTKEPEQPLETQAVKPATKAATKTTAKSAASKGA